MIPSRYVTPEVVLRVFIDSKFKAHVRATRLYDHGIMTMVKEGGDEEDGGGYIQGKLPGGHG